MQASGEERTEQRRQGPRRLQTQCPRGKGESKTNSGVTLNSGMDS